jgi:thiol-disulfide isomerase/thioredoxin
MKAPKQQEKSTPNRWILGAIVAVVILGVVAIKTVGQQPTAVSLTLEATSTPVPTQPVVKLTLGPLPGPALPPTAIAAGSDPLPANPAAQVEWIKRNKKPAMLLYHSTNCIPCKEMERLMKLVRADYEPDVVFVKVITNDQANMAEVRRAGIQYIPTIFFVSRSGQSEKVVGAMKEGALRAKLADLKAGQ